ncbi:MAG: phosphoesterase, PA-phosphatase related protein [Segetibacter sp.]|nr:phosphoesterase, PA-phosphatase related protein [Segetibacter sp.]
MFNRLNNSRGRDAYNVRQEANELNGGVFHPDHLSNGDEEDYRDPAGKLSYIGNYSKGLRHNKLGEVIPDVYRLMVRAMYSTDPILFERPEMMGTIDGINLINPQSGLAFDLEGPDPQAVTMPPAPRLDSAEEAAEMAELYWMARLRDFDFDTYSADPIVAQAANSLNPPAFTAFKGPKQSGLVTPQTLFRGNTSGDLVGPYVSQFLLKPIPYGTVTGTTTGGAAIEQLNRVAKPGVDYLTNFIEWRAIQNGKDRRILNMLPDTDPDSLYDSVRRPIRNLRDLATYVHFDALYEAYLNACLILLDMPARVDPGNPYIDNPRQPTQHTQDGFGTFGPPHILTLVTEVATRALKAVWFQKWGVHRRLRPEEFGGRLHVQLARAPGRYDDMIHSQILDALSPGGTLDWVRPTYGTYLLPQAFIEGCPAHPAYASGHATVAGACVTVLKAWFDESEVFDADVVPSMVTIPGVPEIPAPGIPDPLTPAVKSRISAAIIDRMKENRRPKNVVGGVITDYVAPLTERKLTIGGELNKLASNISNARNAAGVHWRSDYFQGIKLGEEIAIRFLQEQKLTYNEDHHLSLTKFDGRKIII